ncbi:MAG: response regulator transcription factor [Rhodobacteraceae bacterium]|nr:response regulator transcription factor [Paracoccaceae bacterium]
MKKRIIVLDDEPEIVRLIESGLEDDGYDVVSVQTIAAFEKAVAAQTFDLHIVDLGLPDGNGLQVIQNLRRGGDCGIIILSGRGSETDRVVGLEVGADDYITKPFRVRELVARVHAVLRRTAAPGTAVAEAAAAAAPEPAAQAAQHSFDGYRLDPAARQLFGPDGAEIALTTSEFNLLAALLERRGQVLNRDQLMNAVKGRDWEVYDRAVDGLVSRLRHKIPRAGGQSHYIRTVHGVGYAFSG